MRIIGVCVCVAALALAGCATQGALTGAAARPKTVIVTDFVASSDVSAIDRGYSTRLERKGGDFPILERNKRTMARVNDEIVASIVASLREAGLDARPGSDEGLTYGDDALLIKGRLRASDKLKPAQMKQVGFGGGRGFVVADMTVSRFTSTRREQLFTFAADASGKRKAATGKAAAATNAIIAAALTAQDTPPEKLSSDVEAPVRRLGAAIGDKVAAYAKEKGWLDKPESAAPAQPAAEQLKSEPPAPPPEPGQPPNSSN
jgi:Domain of unknown function (DUF4410)